MACSISVSEEDFGVDFVRQIETADADSSFEEADSVIDGESDVDR